MENKVSLIQLKLRKVFLISLLFLVWIPVVKSSEFNATNFDEKFKEGEITLSCDNPICRGKFGWNRRSLKEQNEQGNWYDLAKNTAELDVNVILAYYYLAKSALKLGYLDAASKYISMSNDVGVNRYCGMGICEGIDIEAEFSNFEQYIYQVKSNQRQKSLANDLPKQDSSTQVITLNQPSLVETSTTQNAVKKSNKSGVISNGVWKSELSHISGSTLEEVNKSIFSRANVLINQAKEARKTWGKEDENKIILAKLAIFQIFSLRIQEFHGKAHPRKVELENDLKSNVVKLLNLNDNEIEQEISNLTDIAKEVNFLTESGKLTVVDNAEKAKLQAEIEDSKRQAKILEDKRQAEIEEAEREVKLKEQYISNLKELAEQGDNKAQYDLGMLYFSGNRVPEDERIATIWLKKSAAQQNSDAQNMLKLIESAKLEKARVRELEKREAERQAILAKKKQAEAKAAADNEAGRLEKIKNLEKLKSL